MTAPRLIAGLVAASGLSWAVALLIDPEPFAPSSAAAIAVGLVTYTVVAVAGILLVHAPWSRGLGLGVAVAGPLLGIATGFGTAAVLGLVFSGSAIVGLTGPWLRVWLRRRPAAGAPPAEAAALALMSITLVPMLGVANHEGLSPSQGLLALAGLVSTWGYARGHLWGLWGLRLVVPTLAVPATLMTPLPGTVLVAAVATSVSVLAWRRQSAAAIATTVALPSPRRRRQNEGESS